MKLVILPIVVNKHEVKSLCESERSLQPKHRMKDYNADHGHQSNCHWNSYTEYIYPPCFPGTNCKGNRHNIVHYNLNIIPPHRAIGGIEQDNESVELSRQNSHICRGACVLRTM